MANQVYKGELATKNSYFSKIYDTMYVRTMMLQKQIWTVSGHILQ